VRLGQAFERGQVWSTQLIAKLLSVARPALPSSTVCSGLRNTHRHHPSSRIVGHALNGSTARVVAVPKSRATSVACRSVLARADQAYVVVRCVCARGFPLTRAGGAGSCPIIIVCESGMRLARTPQYACSLIMPSGFRSARDTPSVRRWLRTALVVLDAFAAAR